MNKVNTQHIEENILKIILQFQLSLNQITNMFIQMDVNNIYKQ